jgi:predicted CoA-binding protein
MTSTPTPTLAHDFLAQRRIAVVGVSRDPARHGANIVYRRLRDRGYAVFAVNPNTDTVEGDRAYPNLRSIPGGVDAVVIGTAPERADGIVRERRDLGISRVWMHRGPGAGSVSRTAADYCRANGIDVIPGGCR